MLITVCKWTLWLHRWMFPISSVLVLNHFIIQSRYLRLESVINRSILTSGFRLCLLFVILVNNFVFAVHAFIREFLAVGFSLFCFMGTKKLFSISDFKLYRPYLYNQFCWKFRMWQLTKHKNNNILSRTFYWCLR